MSTNKPYGVTRHRSRREETITDIEQRPADNVMLFLQIELLYVRRADNSSVSHNVDVSQSVNSGTWRSTGAVTTALLIADNQHSLRTPLNYPLYQNAKYLNEILLEVTSAAWISSKSRLNSRTCAQMKHSAAICNDAHDRKTLVNWVFSVVWGTQRTVWGPITDYGSKYWRQLQWTMS